MFLEMDAMISFLKYWGQRLISTHVPCLHTSFISMFNQDFHYEIEILYSFLWFIPQVNECLVLKDKIPVMCRNDVCLSDIYQPLQPIMDQNTACILLSSNDKFQTEVCASIISELMLILPLICFHPSRGMSHLQFHNCYVIC